MKDVIPKGIQVPDYENLYLPRSEEFIKEEITLHHPVLLAERDALNLIISSIEKIKENVDELL